MFSLYDKRNNGVIKLKELGTILRCLGQMPTEDELSDILHEADPDRKKSFFSFTFLGNTLIQVYEIFYRAKDYSAVVNEDWLK